MYDKSKSFENLSYKNCLLVMPKGLKAKKCNGRKPQIIYSIKTKERDRLICAFSFIIYQVRNRTNLKDIVYDLPLYLDSLSFKK
jgi:hypothetical protein